MIDLIGIDQQLDVTRSADFDGLASNNALLFQTDYGRGINGPEGATC